MKKKQKPSKTQSNKKTNTQTPELGENKFVVEGIKSGKQIFELERMKTIIHTISHLFIIN